MSQFPRHPEDISTAEVTEAAWTLRRQRPPHWSDEKMLWPKGWRMDQLASWKDFKKRDGNMIEQIKIHIFAILWDIMWRFFEDYMEAMIQEIIKTEEETKKTLQGILDGTVKLVPVEPLKKGE
ncbi:MAG: hypothetical protein DRO67_10385 [Candidatus Asgardarchaeum californiense]|nr:MAG: hypothetical protein DRO67_10385 [Candidatus Asgardarchaeum californiense]